MHIVILILLGILSVFFVALIYCCLVMAKKGELKWEEEMIMRKEKKEE